MQDQIAEFKRDIPGFEFKFTLSFVLAGYFNQKKGLGSNVLVNVMT
tara:strand:+ start:827 stop:964 length:138 start_codon:yes stop_codon:yes gene_type:complete